MTPETDTGYAAVSGYRPICQSYTFLRMIRRASPLRFDRIAEAGRNRPLRVVVETPDGAEHEAFLKTSGSPEVGVEGLANEALAACVAGDLGLPINEPFLVDLAPSWIASIPDREVRKTLERSVPMGFGSRSAGSPMANLVGRRHPKFSASAGSSRNSRF
jgi:hypothetical protein